MLDPDAAVRAIEAGLLLHWRILGESEVTYYQADDDLVTYGPRKHPSAFFDGVLMARFASADADARIDDVLGRFGYPASPVIWQVPPSAAPVDLGARLAARGLVLRTELPGMAVSLDAFNDEATPPGLEIEVVNDSVRFRTLHDITATSFGMPPGLSDVFYRAYTSVAFDDPRWIPYLGLLYGEPVASTILMRDGETAGLYAVAVKSEFERRGIGGALTLRALRDARDLGCTLAVLRASEVGAPMYARLGFREYCRIAQYWHVPGVTDRAQSGLSGTLSISRVLPTRAATSTSTGDSIRPSISSIVSSSATLT
jgi:GNAT superfamily N-acetyltransferase